MFRSEVVQERPIWTRGRDATLAVVLALLVLIHIGISNVRRMAGTMTLITQSRLVLDRAEHVRLLFTAAQSSERALVVTGADVFRASLARSIHLMTIEVDELRRLSLGTPSQRARVVALEGEIGIAVSELQSTVDLLRWDRFETNDAAASVFRQDADAERIGHI